MAYLHCQDWVHLDVKPENIFLCQSYTKLLLADFGLAKKVGASTAHVGGSPDYFDPALLSLKKVEPANDMYSFGVTSYVFLTKNNMWPKMFSDLERVKRAEQGERPAIHKLSQPEISELIKWCWHADIRQRPSSVQVVE